MRLLVIGAGSTGGYLGGRLALAERDVTFLVRPARAEKLRETGLRIVSPRGDATFQPKLVTAGNIERPYDVVLLTVKGFQLEAAIEDVAPAISAETMILPVLNGMRHVEILGKRFSPHNLVGCALKVATVLGDDGRIIQLTPMQEITYGEWDGSVSPRIEKLHAFFSGAGFDGQISTHIQRDMWEKWILLAGVGGATCLMRGAVGQIEAAAGGAAFASQFLDEVVAVVRAAAGTPPSDALVASARAQMTAKGSPLTSSMYRDLQQQHPVEVEQIIGDLVRLGQKAGIATPLLAAAYVHLSVYQNGLAKPGAATRAA
jgi:2-dehydropantoate 2-reductase